jgi:hypothetical protein
MSSSRPLAATVLGGMILALLVGCGSSDNGIASKSAAEILAASKTAVQNASSVTIKSKSAQGPIAIADIQLRLTKNGGQVMGTILGSSFEVLRTGNTVYLKEPSLYKDLGVTRHVSLETWVKAPANGQLQGATATGRTHLRNEAAFTNLAYEATRLMTPSGKLEKGKTTRIEGQPVIELKARTGNWGTRLYIKTTGEPYPVKLEKTGEEIGKTTFTAWNAPLTIHAPPSAVDISELQHTKGH